MPVIINDFQIDVEPAPQSQTRGGGDSDEQQQQSAPSKVKPEDVTSILKVNRERMERLRAD